MQAVADLNRLMCPAMHPIGSLQTAICSISVIKTCVLLSRGWPEPQTTPPLGVGVTSFVLT